MQAFEKLGVFYLGRPYDLEQEQIGEAPLLYEAADLTTHGVCVGMTGSGKTGLCVSLLEEAALDGIPAIAIDPKGDLGNLMLTFPGLSAEEFEPWVQADDARRKGQSVAEYAAGQAELWRSGLADWGQDGERIRRLRDAVDCRIYTPGSEAGLPVSILASLGAPGAEVREDREAFGDRIETTVTSLLALIGVEADPVQSQEHLLLSSILDHQWRQGAGIDLGGLIGLVQEPPVSRVGVLELESFYPAKERFKLATRLNALLASPGFGVWLQGQPLDIDRILFNDQGKPRIAVFSIAHLSDEERMFFVSLLLSELVGWVRSQPGTSNLRALLYMDEVFGFMPPVAQPPSKKPLLTLLKQARAHGLGVLLATQNPVDLDYKGLSNTGTWFLGRLQTERDKMRVLEGLESLSGTMSKQDLDRTLSQLGKRVFLLHNVHEPAPVLFHTRWAMSYLRGPLARAEISRLMDPFRPELPDPENAAPAAEAAAAPAGGQARPAEATDHITRPVLDPGIETWYLPDSGAGGEYRPGLLGTARMYFANRSKTLEHREEVCQWLLLGADASRPDWDASEELTLDGDSLGAEPRPQIPFAELPAAAASPDSYAGWRKDFVNHLYRNRRVQVLRCDELDAESKPGEDERDFRIRLGELARAERDRRADELREDYAARQEKIAERIARAEAKVAEQKAQARDSKLSAVISAGTTILSAVLGRKGLSRGTVSDAQTAMRRASRTSKEKRDVELAEDSLERLEEELVELEQSLQADLDAMRDKLDPLTAELDTVELKPLKRDVEVTAFGLGWRLG